MQGLPYHAVKIPSCEVVLLFLLVAVAGTAQARPHVERVSFAPRADGHGYVVRVHTSDLVQAYWEPRFLDDDRLEWRLFDTAMAGAVERDDPEGPVGSYSVAEERRELVLRFELERDVEAEVYRDGSSTDLLLSLTYVDGAGAGAPVAVAAAAPGTVTPGASGERWKLDTVVIDAGHGGRDPGARAHGVREKDVTLGVALKLGHYLEERLGIDVVYTREDDRFIPLRDRGHIANQAGGKLFISIHANAARNTSAQGAETFFLGMHKSEAARTVMERENSVIRYESDTDHYEAFDEQQLIVQTMTQSAYMRKSEQLAELLQEQFAERVHRKNRGVKQAGFYVLWSASMPAILVELGFVTNPREAAFLESETGQDYLASAIFRAVRAFKAQYEKGLAIRQ